MSRHHQALNRWRWATVARATLERDGYRCRIRLPGCETVATQADHIVALEDGGAPYDLSNTQAACGKCNNSKRRKILDLDTSWSW